MGSFSSIELRSLRQNFPEFHYNARAEEVTFLTMVDLSTKLLSERSNNYPQACLKDLRRPGDVITISNINDTDIH